MKKEITFEYDLKEIKNIRSYFWNLELTNTVLPTGIQDKLDALDHLLVTITIASRK
tara:strand:+ start:475 stop:642 length:168 start_codon:yes stop_codon:yes gene_type:complete